MESSTTRTPTSKHQTYPHHARVSAVSQEEKNKWSPPSLLGFSSSPETVVVFRWMCATRANFHIFHTFSSESLVGVGRFEVQCNSCRKFRTISNVNWIITSRCVYAVKYVSNQCAISNRLHECFRGSFVLMALKAEGCPNEIGTTRGIVYFFFVQQRVLKYANE